MKITFAETKAIADTLPIGLYAKRRIPISMSETEETSFYSPMTDEIVISYPIISRGLEKASETDYKETAIRSMQYHEVAHAILTPDRLPMPDWMNVFEDERIETILNGYFLDVNFKKQALLVNGYSSASEIGTPKSGFEYYYNIVRFGVGSEYYVNRVSELIKKYSSVTKKNDYDTWSYYDEVRALYYNIVKDFSDRKPKETEGEGADGSGSSSVMMDKLGSNGKSGSPASADETSVGSSADEDGDEEEAGFSDVIDRESPLSADEISALMEETFCNNPYCNAGLTQKMSVIIDNFSKRNNSGSSMSAYSGVFNPRAVARRDDYKYWDKKSTVNGVNRFGTLHLNLFIDESGSFYASTNVMNQLIYSLGEIEKRNKNFTFDVVFCGMGERLVTDKRKRVFKASGGNRLDKNVYNLFRKLQKPNTYNYNIACFDGDACSDGGRDDHGFGAFDTNNSTIISDKSNEYYISKDVHTAKVIYTYNYAEELIDNVVAILSRAFR